MELERGQAHIKYGKGMPVAIRPLRPFVRRQADIGPPWVFKIAPAIDPARARQSHRKQRDPQADQGAWINPPRKQPTNGAYSPKNPGNSRTESTTTSGRTAEART
ncbi:hypothetical protein MishRS11D_01330 [Methylomagnum ishizawai]|nr:hypothetical protein MishRS11D_01330 [Methylomagnum ishizawai]